MPLVIVLHGAIQGNASAERMSGMSALADKEKFVAVYPQGTSMMGNAPTWNAGNCCGYAQQKNVDDIAFLRALIGKLEKDYSIDAKRIYVTGISNGGMMSFRVACEMADVVAAVAPVEGAQNVDCKPSAPVSVIVFHGTADRLVPFQRRLNTVSDRPAPQRHSGCRRRRVLGEGERLCTDAEAPGIGGGARRHATRVARMAPALRCTPFRADIIRGRAHRSATWICRRRT